MNDEQGAELLAALERLTRAVHALKPPERLDTRPGLLTFTVELAAREQRIVRLESAHVFRPLQLEFAREGAVFVMLRSVAVAREPQELAVGECRCSLFARPSEPFEFRTGVLGIGHAIELELRNTIGQALTVSGKVMGRTVPPLEPPRRSPLRQHLEYPIEPWEDDEP